MLTLSGIIVVIGIISTCRLYKSCKKQNIPFNPLAGSIMDSMGFYLGIVIPFIVGLSTLMYLIVKYLH